MMRDAQKNNKIYNLTQMQVLRLIVEICNNIDFVIYYDY